MSNVIEFDDFDLHETLKVASEFGTDRFGYVVTPNVDHIIRHCDDANFRAMYADATYVVLDSRFLANTAALIRGQRLPVCCGSDLATSVFGSVLKANDVTVLVGATKAQAETLRARFGLKALHHIDPPMNFIRNPAAVEDCLKQIEALAPFRFCFLAIGSPQQEILAQKLKARGKARGLALCIGAAINFMTGVEQRAPQWMQNLGLEWLFRLMSSPRRLAKRYLIKGPRFFLLLPSLELKLRRRSLGSEVKDLGAATSKLHSHGATIPVGTTAIAGSGGSAS
jgi:exopolysaccharide biosynthesis WecB/TagA/CpsF family protein